VKSARELASLAQRQRELELAVEAARAELGAEGVESAARVRVLELEQELGHTRAMAEWVEQRSAAAWADWEHCHTSSSTEVK
jgi:hypothetical protein